MLQYKTCLLDLFPYYFELYEARQSVLLNYYLC